MSRDFSNPVELHKLSIVDKQSRQSENHGRDISPTRLTAAAQANPPRSPSPRRQGIQFSIPIESSPSKGDDKGEISPVSSSSASKRDSVSSLDHCDQDLLFKLAAKKRQIVEMEQELQVAKRELYILETQYRSTISGPQTNSNNSSANNGSGTKNEMIQHWSKRVQKTLDDVNNSPNVLKSKKSISNFFNGETTPVSEDNLNKNARSNLPPPPPPRPRPLPPSYRTQTPQEEARSENRGKTGFFQNLVDKFNEFSVAEEEEEEFDRTQNKFKDDFYLKEKLDYDDDEEIENEEVGGTLLNVRDSTLKNIYKR